MQKRMHKVCVGGTILVCRIGQLLHSHSFILYGSQQERRYGHTHPRQLHGDREKQKYLSQEDTCRGREAFPRVRMQRETSGAAAESIVFTRQAEVVTGQEQLLKVI